MLVIGLTGGIGSGKTTVANLFAQHGITLIDTDQIARDVIQPHQTAYQKILDHFGLDILQNDKSIDRSKLRKLIFSDTNEKLWLENLLHPLIRQEMQQAITHATSPYVIAIIPLLLETTKNPLIDRVLVVDADEEKQIHRTCLRDKVSAEDVKAILRTQIDRAKRLEAADDVVHNHGSVEELISQVDKLHHVYLNIANPL